MRESSVDFVVVVSCLFVVVVVCVFGGGVGGVNLHGNE